MGKRQKVIIASLIFCGIASTNLFAEMPNGTAVIGEYAYDLNYLMNATKEENEKIRLHVIEGKEIYVKDFNGKWRFNSTYEMLINYDNMIPKVEYKGIDGKVKLYEKGDGDVIIKTISQGTNNNNNSSDSSESEEVYFEGFKGLNAIEVLIGNKFILPEKVKALYSDGSAYEYSVIWDSSSVDVFKLGTYKVEGKVAELNKKVSIEVKVRSSINIKEIAKLDDVVLEFAELYSLPARVPVILQTGEKVELRIEWDGTIDTNIPGVYNLVGTIYGTTETTTLNVIVKDYVERVQYWIKKPSYISYENILKSAIECRVNLDNVSKVKVIVDNEEMEGLAVDVEGNFKVDVSGLKEGTIITIKLYDKNGVEVDSLDIVKTI